MQLHCGISSEPYIFWQWKSPKCNQAQETVSEKCKKRTHLLRRLPLATHSCVLYVLQTYSRIRYMSVFLVSVSQKSQTFLCMCIIRTESVDLCCRICVHTSIYILKIDRFSPCKQNVFLCVSFFFLQNGKSTNWNGPKRIWLYEYFMVLQASHSRRYFMSFSTRNENKRKNPKHIETIWLLHRYSIFFLNSKWACFFLWRNNQFNNWKHLWHFCRLTSCETLNCDLLGLAITQNPHSLLPSHCFSSLSVFL